jgi:vacuolar-type H+-ATPase subunit I/STV1
MEVCGKKADNVSESCELCLIEGLSTQADGFCHECDECMCSKCFQHHVKRKLSRNHVLSPLGKNVSQGKQQAESNEKCKTHVRENVKYYCRKHDIVTCGDCIVGDHQGCKLDFISNLANQFENSSEFKDIVQKIEKLEAAQKENKTQIDRNRKENKACLDTALAEIKKFRKDINEHLDKVETEIIFEANKMAKQNDDILDQLEKMLSVAEQDIDDIRNNLDANMIQGVTLFIRTKEYKPKLSKSDESITLIRAQNAIRGFTFEQEKQLADLIKSSVKLGCLRRDTATDKEPTVIQKTNQPIETVKPVMTGATADKQVEAKQSYLLTGNL